LLSVPLQQISAAKAALAEHEMLVLTDTCQFELCDQGTKQCVYNSQFVDEE
jgi:hypothetical protein